MTGRLWKKYPVIPGESYEERKRRLNTERCRRARGYKARAPKEVAQQRIGDRLVHKII